MVIFGKKKEKNINLIPKEDSSGGFSKKDYLIPIMIPILAIGIVVIVFATLFTLEQAASLKANDLEEKINAQISQWQQHSEKAETIKKLNSVLGTYRQGAEQNIAFSSQTKKVRSAIPNGLRLTKFSVKEAGSVAIEGISQNPTIIFQLFNRLKSQESDFSDVELLSIGYQSSDQGGGGQQEQGFIFSITLKVN